eukprot:1155974-Amphidinium_carterae.1
MHSRRDAVNGGGACHREEQQESCATSLFNVEAGDIKGYDLRHLPAATVHECCGECAGESTCGAFVFSAK